MRMNSLTGLMRWTTSSIMMKQMRGRKVKFVVTILKGHASLWWNVVQTKRINQGKVPIKNWNRMVAKLRGKFLPEDFQISLFKRMQNLKQKTMTVREYTEEF